jgi:hypothetical protein
MTAEGPVDPLVPDFLPRHPSGEAVPGFHWPALTTAGLDAVVTTREGGVSEEPYASLNLGLHVGDDAERVVENRRRALAILGADLTDAVFAQQVHGAHATVVTRAEAGRGATTHDDAIPDTDILVTATPGLVVAILVADCVPIVLFDPTARALAVVHAGWRGTVAGAVHAGLDALRDLGGTPARVVAGIGPAIPAATYEVGPEVAAEFRSRFPTDPGDPDSVPRPVVTESTSSGHPRIDLPEANRHTLIREGVPRKAIHGSNLATGPGTPFFSDRAARPCGRFGLLARIPPQS